MPEIKVCGAKPRFVERFYTLKVDSGELLVIYGPTGSGKTTLLNIVAGLIAYEGNVFFNDIPVDCVPPQKRNIGYLFQGLHLFPHLSVFNNIAYGLKIKKIPSKKIKGQVNELMELLEISHLENRYLQNLSGGEKQRVALARTIAPRPDVLLMDEPLSSLDENIAIRLRRQLKSLQRELALTTIYVTHDSKESSEMADNIYYV